jgi:cytochrome c-type biogenesis protein CcmH/NrfG
MSDDKLSLAATATQNPEEIRALMQDLVNERSWEALERLARRATQLRPQQQEFHLMLGTALHNLGRAREAEQAYAKCLQINPRNVRGLVKLGSLQISGGQPAVGLKALDAALYLDPDNEDALREKGRGLGILGQPDKALAVFEELLKKDPDDVASLKSAALCHMEIGHNTKAAELLNRAALLAPFDAAIADGLNKLSS